MYDEPTAGLDPVASTVVEDLIRSLQSQRETDKSVEGISSYIVVTHQHSTIRRAVDRLIFLHEVYFSHLLYLLLSNKRVAEPYACCGIVKTWVHRSYCTNGTMTQEHSQHRPTRQMYKSLLHRLHFGPIRQLTRNTSLINRQVSWAQQALVRMHQPAMTAMHSGCNITTSGFIFWLWFDRVKLCGKGLQQSLTSQKKQLCSSFLKEAWKAPSNICSTITAKHVCTTLLLSLCWKDMRCRVCMYINLMALSRSTIIHLCRVSMHTNQQYCHCNMMPFESSMRGKCNSGIA